jgi:hypothetical protein
MSCASVPTDGRGGRRLIVIASKTKPALLAVLVVFVACAGISSTASAANLGPFWHVNNTQLGQGASRALTGKLTQPQSAALYGEIGTLKIKIVCEVLTGTGTIWNGTAQGENEETLSFSTCKAFEQGKTTPLTGCKIKEPIVAEAHSSLWYHTRVNGTATERTNSIQVVFTPTQAKGNVFAEITISKCEETGFNISSAKIEGDVAAVPIPENKEVEKGILFFPTEQQKHIWRPTSQQLVESQQELKFAGNEAKLQGEAEVELTTKEKFGVFE